MDEQPEPQTGWVKQRFTDRLFERETDFIFWLASLMNANPFFSRVTLEPLIGTNEGRRARADIMAVRQRGEDRETLIIECKNRPLYGLTVAEAIEQVLRYASLAPTARPVLALPGRLTETDRVLIRSSGIELWDIDALTLLFNDEIRATPGPLWEAFSSSSKALKSQEERLVEELRNCTAGRGQWSVYQKLVGRVLEHCFCPPLNAPLSESPDESGTNRRDFILANFAENGFWSYARSRYSADYIIVDAKNYVGRIKKRDVLQIANYLKPHGAGMLGIIFSRAGADQSAKITAREQWAHYKKLVLVLNDEQCEAMINGMPSGEAPLVLAKEIQNFRLSM